MSEGLITKCYLLNTIYDFIPIFEFPISNFAMKKITFFFLLTVTIILILTGCSKKENPPPDTDVYSVNGGKTSHNNGSICMTCHASGGTSIYKWVVAGSVYKADQTTFSPNGIIYFWSEPNGTGELVATLEVDANGNFFTNVSILPGLGAYPQMRGISGDIRTMPILATTGNCNSCHGVDEDPIWIN